MTASHESPRLKLTDRNVIPMIPHDYAYCVTCGICASLCPATGIDGFNPRELIRMVELGQWEKLVSSRWLHICTMCGKCDVQCPMGINIARLVRSLRPLLDRKRYPPTNYSGLVTHIKTGNINGLSSEEFVAIMKQVAAEIRQEPGYEKFEVPIDKKGANLLLTIHNKLVKRYQKDLKTLWKGLYAAGEDWTIASTNQEGANWAFFTGDDNLAKIAIGRIVEHMERLDLKTLAWPE